LIFAYNIVLNISSCPFLRAWRHVKEVMQGKGKRIMFVDGITSIDDLARVKTNMILGGVRTPKPLSARLTDSEC